MKILVTGGTGFVGAALVRRLQTDACHEVSASIRRESRDLFQHVNLFNVGELSPETDWSSAVSDVDVIVHTAARVHPGRESAGDSHARFREINVEGTMRLARQAAAARVRRFIFVSSIKVNGESTITGKPFVVEDRPSPTDPYGISKWESEIALRRLAKDSDMEVVIIRPPLIYGPGVKGNFLKMIRWADSGMPLPFGSIKNKRSLVALDNLLDFIVTCIDHPAAANETFLVSDGEDVSTPSLLRQIGRALGKEVVLVPVPARLLVAAASLLGERKISEKLLGSLQLDNSKACSLLNWVPPVSLSKALQKTVDWFKSAKLER